MIFSFFQALFIYEYQILFGSVILSFFSKIIIFITLIRKKITTNSLKSIYNLLTIILIAATITDFAWIFRLIKMLIYPNLSYKYVLFFIRIAWGFFILQYQLTSLFIESIIDKKITFSIQQKIFSCISLVLSCFFFAIAIIHFDCNSPFEIYHFERFVRKYISFYLFIPLMLFTILQAFLKIKKNQIPIILKKQFHTLLSFIIIPHWFSEFIHLFPFAQRNETQITQSVMFTALSTLLLTFAIFFCARKIMGLRFLNLQEYVNQPQNNLFMNNFKVIFERLNTATNLHELCHISTSFFKETFHIPLKKTHLYLRALDTYKKYTVHPETHVIVTHIESFLKQHEQVIMNYTKRHPILIYDEIAFTHFYNETKQGTIILQFLDLINADIFVPVYDQKKLAGYIIVNRHARQQELYTSTEQDQMIMYAMHVGKIVNLLQNKNFDAIIAQQKKMELALYEKHREIQQYKESMKYFLQTNTDKKIGILFYKNRHFIFGNKKAEELIAINLNTYKGHPTAKILFSIAKNVEQYKSSQTTQIKDKDNNILVIEAIPYIDNNSVIITISQPDISDIIRPHIDLLQNPTEWDYLLYLQTTESGKLINQLIPGVGSALINFKINLLHASLSKKALLLDVPSEDIDTMIALLHRISLRDKLHVLTMRGPEKGIDIPKTLFGINPLFNIQKETDPPLLESLHQIGTLYIKNIHFLSLETQDHLAELLQYGTYKIFKSEQRKTSDVRIICSTDQNIQQLVENGRFSKKLFIQLSKTTIQLPKLEQLSIDELYTLAEGFSTQTAYYNEFKNFLSLSDKEKQNLISVRPTSLQELKHRVDKLIKEKSEKIDFYKETTFDPEFSLSDSLLVEAAKRGKQALKDKVFFEKLWNKLQNQNKIAKLLGVNRSSVYRRCKDYNLTE